MDIHESKIKNASICLFCKNSLEECVLPEIKSSWNKLKNNSFPNGIATDGRTPGLFKD